MNRSPFAPPPLLLAERAQRGAVIFVRHQRDVRRTIILSATTLAVSLCAASQHVRASSWHSGIPYDDASRHHHIVSRNNFVILDGERAQKFRVLGVLPFLQTWSTQIVVLGIVLAVTIIVGALILRTGTQGGSTASSGDLHSIFERLPDPLARLAISVYFEATSYGSVLVEEVMAYVHAPLTLGLNLASRLAGSSSLPRQPDNEGIGSVGSMPEATAKGGRRRRKQHLLKRDPASSQSADSSSTNGGAYYPGLWNTGNSCFLNSTLQNLASVDGIQIFLEHVIAQAEQWDVITPVTDALYEVILQLNTPSTSRTAIIPRQLTDALSSRPQSNVGSFFYAHQQQDAHELLVLITSALDDEVMSITKERDAALHAQSAGLRAVFAPVLRSRQSSTPLNNPFRALIAQRTACLDCGYVEAVRHYSADELSLNVPPRAGSTTTIEACLASWSKLEVVDWICFQCSVVRTLDRVRAEKSMLAAAVDTSGSTRNGHVTATSRTQSGSSEQATTSSSKKKKSGAKRRRMLEVLEKEKVLMEILKKGYSEDEVEALHLLQQQDVKLDRTFSRAATKQVMLARTPRILLIHLNRSSYSASNFGASKNNAAVLFDEELDLGDVVTGGDLSVRGDQPISRGTTPSLHDATNELNWTTHAQGRRGKASMDREGDTGGYVDHVGGSKSTMRTRYALCGIVVHYGGHSSGHYVAFRRRLPRKRSHELSFAAPQNGGITAANLQDIDGDETALAAEQSVTEQHRSGAFAAWSMALASGGVRDMYDSSGAEQWYRISDDSVNRCSLQDVMMQNPFLLFYERLGDPTSVDRHCTLDSAPVVNGVVNGKHSQEPRGASAKNGDCNAFDASRPPRGFESLAQLQRRRLGAVPYRPRIVQRWETSSQDWWTVNGKKENRHHDALAESKATNGDRPAAADGQQHEEE